MIAAACIKRVPAAAKFDIRTLNSTKT